MINIVFYIVVTGLLVGATVCGVYRRYHRNEFENFDDLESDSDSLIQESNDMINDLAIL